MRHFDPKRISLKARIVISFFSILLVMIGATFFTLQRFIVHFTETQLDDDYENILSEACDTIEDLLWNLTLTSGQILDNESIRDTMILYQETASPYERQTYYVNLLDSITMLTLANTDVSLLYVYDESNKDFVYSSFPVNKDRRNQAPVLYQNVAFSFCGPYQSQSNYNGNPVLILNRTETLPNGRSVVLSIESGFYSLLTPIKSTERKSAYLAVTGSSGDLIYTTLPDQTAAEAMSILEGSKEYRTMSKSMPQGWGVHLIIPNRVYRMDYYQSLSDILLCMVVIAAFVALIGAYFWKSVYSPLRLFDKQLELLLADENDSGQVRSSIPEYDYLLQKVGSMQKEIQEMIRRIIAQEKDNTKMQIEKLRAQINPHFLLNTLNTVHWIALMNEQEEIDAITQSLAHLLSYNLDKDSVSTNLEKELKALTEYVHLQRVRYDFHFTIDRPTLNGELNYPCPKFLLQPLVENALSHGYRPGMEISVHILVDDLIRLTVSDTGTGMDAETLARVNRLQPSCEPDIGTACVPSEDKISKFGIGLAYVLNSMHDFFSDSFHFSISSSENQGTTNQIEFPKLKGSDYHVKILIVDDDPLTRKGIQVLMPWEKHHMKIVGECSNGKDALTFLEQTMVDLVLVDIDMPVMDGITFMKTATKLYPELNYVVLTVHTEFDYIQNVLRLGAMDYIAKTQFDKENFDEILNRIHTGIIHKRASFSGSGDLRWKETKILYPSIFALVSAEVESDEHVFEFWERNGLSGKKDIYELMGGVWVFIVENNSFVFPDSFSLFMLLRIWDVSDMTYAQLGKLLRRSMKDSFFYEYQPVCLVHDIQAYELCEKGPTADVKTAAQTREALLALKWVIEVLLMKCSSR